MADDLSDLESAFGSDASAPAPAGNDLSDVESAFGGSGKPAAVDAYTALKESHRGEIEAQNKDAYDWAGPLQGTFRAIRASSPSAHVPLGSWGVNAASAAIGAGLGYGDGDSYSKRYNDIRARQDMGAQINREKHPIADVVGDVGASLTLPTFGAEKAGAAVGNAVADKLGPGFLSKTAELGTDAAASAALAGGYSAASAGSESGTPEERLARAQGAGLTGLEIGATLSPISKIAGKVIGKGIDRFRGAGDVDAEAARRVRGALEADKAARENAVAAGKSTEGFGLQPEDVAAAQRAGQPWVYGDLGGETTRALARSAKNTSTDAANALTGPLEDRFKDQSGRLGDLVRNMFGTHADAGLVRDTLAAKAKAANDVAYKAAYASPGAQAMWHEGFGQLLQSPSVQRAIGQAETVGKDVAAAQGYKAVANPFIKDENGMWQLGKQADGSIATPSLEFWDKVKQGLDAQASVAYRAGNKFEGNTISDLRNHLRGMLDDAVPEYAAARSGAAGFFGAEDAHEAGANFLKNMGAYDLADARKALTKMSAPERELFANGVAADIANRADRMGDSTNVVRLFNSPQNRLKLQEALGPDRSAQIETFLRRESMMNMLRTSVNGNSSSARQFLALGLAGGTAGVELGKKAWESRDQIKDHPGLVAAGVGSAALAGLFHHYSSGINKNVAARVGEMLASNDPETLQKLMTVSARSREIRDAIRATEMGLAKNVGVARGTNAGQ